MRATATVLLVAAVASSASQLHAAAGLRGIGVDEKLSEGPLLVSALNVSRLPTGSLPLFVRVAIDRARWETTEPTERFRELDARVQLYRARNVMVLLSFSPLTGDVTQTETWRRLVWELATRYQGSVRGYQIGLPTDSAGKVPPREFAFLVKTAAVEIRGADPAAAVILEGLAVADPEWRAAVYAEGLAPYVDGLAATGGTASAVRLDLDGLSTFLEREDPEAVIVAGGMDLGDDPHEAARRMLRFELSHRSGRISLTTYSAPPEALSAALSAAASLRDILIDDVVPLDVAAALPSYTLADGRSATDAVVAHLLYDTTRFSTVIAYWALPGTTTSLRVELAESTGRTPVVRDPWSRKVERVADFAWDKQSNRARMSVPLSEDPLVLDFNFGGEETRASRVEVTGKALPTVGEIIFRYQQVQAAQDAVVVNYMAAAHMEHHLRPSLTASGYDIVTENRFFANRGGVEWEELSFSLNGSRWGPGRPPFPLLQPEKVLSLPLDLRLNADYGYELAGIEKLGERESYVIRFSPKDDSKPLYRGSVWIDSQTFARLKVQAVQTRPGVPVVSNEEIQIFAPVASAGGRSLYLLSRLIGRQIFLIAGRNLLVERDVRFSDFRVNSADFDSLRESSHKSNNIMYRDTDRGIRYLVKRDGKREVSERSTKTATALAVGTMVDPSYDFPLPIVGINHLNFEFLGKDSQLAVLFGGVLALVNVQRPRIAGSRVDASFDLFAIAISGNDQVFDANGERKAERVKTRPFSTGINLGWQFTEFQKLTGSYHLEWMSFGATDQTDPGFVVPVDTATHGYGLAYEYKRAGYSLQANATFYRRARWNPWGPSADSDFDPKQKNYRKYSVNLSKDYYSGPHKLHLNAAYFGGKDLDRFGMYQFGLFDDARMHGVPSAGVRFPELGMLRASYSYNLFELYRLDLFVEQAVGKDPGGTKRWHSVTGLGVGFSVRGPFGTLVQGDVGKSFLPEIYSGSGSFVGQIQFLKPL